jgi:cell shape-determining protein MreC
VGDFFTAQSRLGGDAISLQATVDQLQAENERLRNENAVVTAQLRDQDATIMQGVTAGVMARIPLSPYDVLIVGKGSDDGVYEQMRAFSNGIPVGTVESVSGKSARIALYSAPGRESEGWLGENRIPVTVRGTGAGTFSADVSRDATVVAGDLVYIPGPGALPIGTVVSIETHPSAPRSVLSIRPMVNPFTMTNVLIVASPSP